MGELKGIAVRSSSVRLGELKGIAVRSSSVIGRVLDRMNDPVVREALDRLVVELQRLSQAKHSTFDEMLRRLDRNQDGMLNREEIGRGLGEMGVQLKVTELDSVMRAFDKDGNGTIDYTEFYTVLTKHHDESARDDRSLKRQIKWMTEVDGDDQAVPKLGRPPQTLHAGTDPPPGSAGRLETLDAFLSTAVEGTMQPQTKMACASTVEASALVGPN